MKMEEIKQMVIDLEKKKTKQLLESRSLIVKHKGINVYWNGFTYPRKEIEYIRNYLDDRFSSRPVNDLMAWIKAHIEENSFSFSATIIVDGLTKEYLFNPVYETWEKGHPEELNIPQEGFDKAFDNLIDETTGTSATLNEYLDDDEEGINAWFQYLWWYEIC